MTKSQLIQKLMEKSNSLSQRDAKTIVDTIFSSMTQALTNLGRNPRTGSQVEVTPKKLPHFKVGKELKERVDNSKSA